MVRGARRLTEAGEKPTAASASERARRQRAQFIAGPDRASAHRWCACRSPRRCAPCLRMLAEPMTPERDRSTAARSTGPSASRASGAHANDAAQRDRRVKLAGSSSTTSFTSSRPRCGSCTRCQRSRTTSCAAVRESRRHSGWPAARARWSRRRAHHPPTFRATCRARSAGGLPAGGNGRSIRYTRRVSAFSRSGWKTKYTRSRLPAALRVDRCRTACCAACRAACRSRAGSSRSGSKASQRAATPQVSAAAARASGVESLIDRQPGTGKIRRAPRAPAAAAKRRQQKCAIPNALACLFLIRNAPQFVQLIQPKRSGTRSAPISGKRVGTIGPSSTEAARRLAQQFLERDAHLQSRQRESRGTCAARGRRRRESFMFGRPSRNSSGASKTLFIAVRRRIDQRDRLAGRNGAAMQRHVDFRRARETAVRRVEPQEFIGRGLRELQIRSAAVPAAPDRATDGPLSSRSSPSAR